MQDSHVSPKKYFTGAEDDEDVAASDDDSSGSDADNNSVSSDADAPKGAPRKLARPSKMASRADSDDDSDAEEDVAPDSDSDASDGDLDEFDIEGDGLEAPSKPFDAPERNFGDISDSDSDDDGDGGYLAKLSAAQQSDILADHHADLYVHNSAEVDAMCKTVRDAAGRIVDPLHRSLPFITKYERARVIGERAKQINAGATPMVRVEPSVIDGYLIALQEFGEKKIPFIVRRPMPNGGVEYWKLADLEII